MATSARGRSNHRGTNGVRQDSGSLGLHLAVVPSSEGKEPPLQIGGHWNKLQWIVRNYTDVGHRRNYGSPFLLIPAEVDEGIPSETYIELAVQDLKGGIVGGLLDMRVEDLKVCL